MLTPIESSKIYPIALLQEPQDKKNSFNFFAINNLDSLSNGTCRDLQMDRIDSLDHFDRKIQQLVRSYLNPEGKEIYEMHQKVSNLDFDNFVIRQDNEILIISAQSVTIIALNDEQYEDMVDSFINDRSDETAEKDNAEAASHASLLTFSSITLIRAITMVFRKEQEIVAFFTQAREEELARVDEDTRERQTKERDKRWNQWMDHWLQKDENHREILTASLKNSTAAAS